LLIHEGKRITRMKKLQCRSALLAVVSAAAATAVMVSCPTTAHASTVNLRIATYNIEADIDNDTGPLPGLLPVLEGIGEETIGSDAAQPVDILALEETTSKTDTIDPIITDLNNFYGSADVYATTPSNFELSTSGGVVDDGNGPNDIIYNSSVLNLISYTGVGSPGGSGLNAGLDRQIGLYEFQPIGGLASSDFYVFVSHMKSSSSGSETTDETDRNDEAQIIRNYEAANLPSTARVLYTGDFNGDSATDSWFATLTNASPPTGPTQGGAFDPIATTADTASTEDWDENSNDQGNGNSILTESDTDIRYRDDLQLMTQNVLDDQAGGLGYVNGTYQTFGNNGTQDPEGTVANETSLPGLTSSESSTVITNIPKASDHFAVVADYTDVVPEPTSLGLIAFGAVGLLLRRTKKNA